VQQQGQQLHHVGLTVVKQKNLAGGGVAPGWVEIQPVVVVGCAFEESQRVGGVYGHVIEPQQAKIVAYHLRQGGVALHIVDLGHTSGKGGRIGPEAPSEVGQALPTNQPRLKSRRAGRRSLLDR